MGSSRIYRYSCISCAPAFSSFYRLASTCRCCSTRLSPAACAVWSYCPRRSVPCPWFSPPCWGNCNCWGRRHSRLRCSEGSKSAATRGFYAHWSRARVCSAARALNLFAAFSSGANGFHIESHSSYLNMHNGDLRDIFVPTIYCSRLRLFLRCMGF